MMKMPRVWSSHELYPPDEPAETRELLRFLLTGDKDPGGRAIIRRAVTEPERKALVDRKQALTPWLVKSHFGEIQTTVVAMLTSFTSKTASDEEWMAMAMQYAYVLGDVPLWAIKRSCDRFQTGNVAPEEVGAKRLDKTFAPSAANIHTIARKFHVPLSVEYIRINAVLAGVAVAPPRTSAEVAAAKAHVEASLAEHRRRFDAGRLAEREEEEARRARIAKEGEESAQRLRLRQFKEAGVDPPRENDTASLPMLLHMGYSIEDHGHGVRVLIPPKREPYVPTTKAMGS